MRDFFLKLPAWRAAAQDRGTRRSAADLGMIGLLLLAVVLGNGGWDMTGPQTTLLAEGKMARMQKELFYVTIWVSLFIFVTVGSTLAWVQWRFRGRKENENDPVPEQTHGKPIVELSLIIASVLLLVIIAIPTIQGAKLMGADPMKEADGFRIVATGYQWWFKFEYPDNDGIITANEMVIPAGRPVRIDLRTMDVTHAFWIPRLGGKVDMVRNRPNWMRIQADRAGYYWGHCSEFCGDSHSFMRFRVIALEEKEFAEWLARARRPARTVDPAAPPAAGTPVKFPRVVEAGFFPANPRQLAEDAIADKMAEWRSRQGTSPANENPKLVAEGRQLFQQLGCIGCHRVNGHEGVGITGPDLTHFGSRTTVAAGLLDNNPANVKRWIMRPESLKQGNLMWIGYSEAAKNMTDAQAIALVAYLESLR